MIASTQPPLHGLLQTLFRQLRRTELVGSPLQLIAETLTQVKAESQASLLGNGDHLKGRRGDSSGKMIETQLPKTSQGLKEVITNV